MDAEIIAVQIAIGQLPKERQVKIQECYIALKGIVEMYKEDGFFALAQLGTEMSVDEEKPGPHHPRHNPKDRPYA